MESSTQIYLFPESLEKMKTMNEMTIIGAKSKREISFQRIVKTACASISDIPELPQHRGDRFRRQNCLLNFPGGIWISASYRQPLCLKRTGRLEPIRFEQRIQGKKYIWAETQGAILWNVAFKISIWSQPGYRSNWFLLLSLKTKSKTKLPMSHMQRVVFEDLIREWHCTVLFPQLIFIFSIKHQTFMHPVWDGAKNVAQKMLLKVDVHVAVQLASTGSQ